MWVYGRHVKKVRKVNHKSFLLRRFHKTLHQQNFPLYSKVRYVICISKVNYIMSFYLDKRRRHPSNRPSPSPPPPRPVREGHHPSIPSSPSPPEGRQPSNPPSPSPPEGRQPSNPNSPNPTEGRQPSNPPSPNPHHLN